LPGILHRELVKRSEEQLRSLNAQIIYELSTYAPAAERERVTPL
jgi:hypothetical protein